MIFVLVKDRGDIVVYSVIMTVSQLLSQLVLWPYILKNIPFYKPKYVEVIVHIRPNLYLFF